MLFGIIMRYIAVWLWFAVSGISKLCSKIKVVDQFLYEKKWNNSSQLIIFTYVAGFNIKRHFIK